MKCHDAWPVVEGAKMSAVGPMWIGASGHTWHDTELPDVQGALKHTCAVRVHALMKKDTYTHAYAPVHIYIYLHIQKEKKTYAITEYHTLTFIALKTKICTLINISTQMCLCYSCFLLSSLSFPLFISLSHYLTFYLFLLFLLSVPCLYIYVQIHFSFSKYTYIGIIKSH